MLLLSARATREMVEAINATTKAIDANTKALKRIESDVGDVKEILKRIEDKADGKTAALKRVEDLIPTRGKERHNEDV